MPSTPTPVLRVSEPRDLVALVPYRLGFVPRRSLALLSLRGPRSRVGLVLRVDLPGPGTETDTCGQVARYLRQDGAAKAVAVVYDDGPETHDDLLRTLRAALDDDGVQLLDGWHVGADRFRSLTCTDAACCPADGWPVAELQGSRVSAEMVGLGMGVAPGREHLLPDLTPMPPDALAAVAAVVEAATPAPDGNTSTWRLQGLAAWRSLLGTCRDGVVAGPAGPLAAARHRQVVGDVLARLSDPWVRDAVLLTAVSEAGDAPESLAADGPDGRTDDLLAAVFGSGEPSAPDTELLLSVRTALAELVRHATGGHRAAALAAMAWSAWWEGDGARAGELSDLALAGSPTNRLGRLVDSAVRAGMAPAWVVRDRAADLAGADRRS